MNTDTKVIDGYGISVALPAGWDAKLYKKADHPGTISTPVLKAANFPLPTIDGDFATAAAESMTAGDLLIVLLEYAPDEHLTVGEGLFRPAGIPTDIGAKDLDPNCMPQIIDGLAGVQRFFSENGRAFCLYMVFGGLPEILAAQEKGEEVELEVIRSIVRSLQISPPTGTDTEGDGPSYESEASAGAREG
jgi:hypothetical protein